MDSSLVQVKGTELYPEKHCLKDIPSLECPFRCIFGECPIYIGKASEGCVVLSNYRLFVQLSNGFVNLPLGLIESVEIRDILDLLVLCKNACSYRITFEVGENCSEWHKRLTKAISFPKKIEDIFAYRFYAWCQEKSYNDVHRVLIANHGVFPNVTGTKLLIQEVKRNGFNLGGAWRITNANEKYALCPTYPKQLLIPASISDDTLESVARFRSSRRFPAVVWRHTGNGAVIARCSQPEVGWLGWRSSEDEDLIKAIAEACADDCGKAKNEVTSEDVSSLGDDISNLTVSQENVQKVLIVDARSYTTAFANRARGGGCECPEYYPNCEIQFMNLANIHSIRKSFHSLRQLCSISTDQTSWLSLLEGTKWLQHMSGLIRASLTVVFAVHHEGRPVVVHCSDGWDRTPQIVSLAELLLDPYYRTFEGFQVLVEREWLEFGHKFSDRCGQGLCDDDPNERCPVFLQWLDCVHQLMRQFPCAFEFNIPFLEKLVQHTYSNLFMTFLFNCSQQQEKQIKSYSVWLYLGQDVSRFRNYLYVRYDQPLEPSYLVRDLRFWSSVYSPSGGSVSSPLSPIAPPVKSPIFDDIEGDEEDENDIVRTRSCDNLNGLTEDGCYPELKTRRNSQPSLDFNDSMSPGGSSVFVQNPIPCACDSLDDIANTVVSHNGGSVDQGDVNDSDLKSFCEHSGKTVNCQMNTICDKIQSDNLSVESSTDTLVADVGLDNCFYGLVGNITSVDHPTVTTLSDVQVYHPHMVLTDSFLSSLDPRNVIGDVPNIYSNLTGSLPGLSQDINAKCQVCLSNRKLLSEKDIDTSLKRPVSNGNSVIAAYETPILSRNASSGCLGTNEESPKSMCSLLHKLDVDGMNTPTDDIQKCLRQVFENHGAEVNTLKEEVEQLRSALSQQIWHKCTHNEIFDDQKSTSDSNYSGEHNSIGNESVTSDIGSWENVEEKDANHTLWVPDHLASHCSQCNSTFWIAKRKHHCRSCGNVFCSDCCDNLMALPKEQLYEPVRVCSLCYKRLTSNTCRQSMMEARSNPKSGVATTASS